jgi:hypothetical protein
MVLIGGVIISHNLNAWKCLVNIQGTFTVNSIYLFLISDLPSLTLASNAIRQIGHIWKSYAPSNVIIFFLANDVPSPSN